MIVFRFNIDLTGIFSQCRKHRELLRAIVAVSLGISFYKVNLKALDAAYSIVFPKSTPLNVNKKKRDDCRKGTT